MGADKNNNPRESRHELFAEVETGEICKEEAITASNCWVMLHRARLALRECLDRNWFQGSRS